MVAKTEEQERIEQELSALMPKLKERYAGEAITRTEENGCYKGEIKISKPKKNWGITPWDTIVEWETADGMTYVVEAKEIKKEGDIIIIGYTVQKIEDKRTVYHRYREQMHTVARGVLRGYTEVERCDSDDLEWYYRCRAEVIDPQKREQVKAGLRNIEGVVAVEPCYVNGVEYVSWMVRGLKRVVAITDEGERYSTLLNQIRNFGYELQEKYGAIDSMVIGEEIILYYTKNLLEEKQEQKDRQTLDGFVLVGTETKRCYYGDKVYELIVDQIQIKKKKIYLRYEIYEGTEDREEDREEYRGAIQQILQAKRADGIDMEYCETEEKPHPLEVWRSTGELRIKEAEWEVGEEILARIEAVKGVKGTVEMETADADLLLTWEAVSKYKKLAFSW